MDWRKDWPTEPGLYWFYGYLWAVSIRLGSEPTLHIVRVVAYAPKSITYICDRQFMYKSEGAQGLWRSLPTPDLPDFTPEAV